MDSFQEYMRRDQQVARNSPQDARAGMLCDAQSQSVFGRQRRRVRQSEPQDREDERKAGQTPAISGNPLWPAAAQLAVQEPQRHQRMQIDQPYFPDLGNNPINRD